jgi:hypothetical protein
VLVNVLRNGCFDLGQEAEESTGIPNGWEVVEGISHQRVDEGQRLVPHSGKFHLWGPDLRVGVLQQTVNLQRLAPLIDAQRVALDLSFFHASFHTTPPPGDDGVNATVTFVLSGIAGTPVRRHSSEVLFGEKERMWQGWRSGWVLVPFGTRKLIVELGCVRYQNQNCDGYLDDVCALLRISDLPQLTTSRSDPFSGELVENLVLLGSTVTFETRDVEEERRCECLGPGVEWMSGLPEEVLLAAPTLLRPWEPLLLPVFIVFLLLAVISFFNR